MELTDTRYLEFDAEVLSPAAELYPGRSGWFLFVDGAPAGIIVRAANLDRTRGTFVRTEEIAMNARRSISDQGVQFTGGFVAALLRKSADGRGSPFPGQTHPTASVTGMPIAVKPFSTATRTWNSAT